jgi:hypothetical protein
MSVFVRSACTRGCSPMLSGKRGERDADERVVCVLELYRH